ncbi:hypothetical protein LP52_17135 [Streptomonospora alba]|uniref:Uncharacterized protein n=1 Tax=Streptomonospora alba TaxID=183763 RepID=A0A0C2JFY5_9ACTN|nr:hypothetical protein LP52_17135 [Streptomonospora alba]
MPGPVVGPAECVAEIAPRVGQEGMPLRMEASDRTAEAVRVPRGFGSASFGAEAGSATRGAPEGPGSRLAAERYRNRNLHPQHARFLMLCPASRA